MEDFQERKINDLTIRIDRTLCIGSGNCIKVTPEFFELDDESVCVFLDNPPEVESERVIEACKVCPVDALIVIDGDGNQIVP